MNSNQSVSNISTYNPQLNCNYSESGNDSLSLYIQDLRQNNYKLLTEDEEIELCKRILNGDSLARNKLIESNLRLVIHIAKKYKSILPIQDLIQEGNIGLMNAINKFDYTLGNRFSTFASFYITQAITKYIHNNSRAIRIPERKLNDIKIINKFKSDYYLMYQLYPTYQEIESGLNYKYSLKQIIELDSYLSPIVSLDTPNTNNEDLDLHEIISDGAESFSDKFSKNELNDALYASIDNSLTEKEATIVKLRYGINDVDEHSLQEIGDKLGISKERVRQILSRALLKLKSQENLANIYLN